MATLDENQAHWAAYDWPEGGEEWSKSWGDPRLMWYGTIYPRIKPFLHPTVGNILEIAAGYGRCSAFLREHLEDGLLTLVDMTPRCIQALQHRFAADWMVHVEHNDGRSLPGVRDASIDFTFSWDSLVHADADTMGAYVRELARVLRPGGRAFLHHSNLADELKPSAHWRDPTMSAMILCEQAWTAGLEVPAQEIVAWEPGVFSDAFSVLRRPMPGEGQCRVQVSHSPDFGDEVARCRRVAHLYWGVR